METSHNGNTVGVRLYKIVQYSSWAIDFFDDFDGFLYIFDITSGYHSTLFDTFASKQKSATMYLRAIESRARLFRSSLSEISPAMIEMSQFKR